VADASFAQPDAESAESPTRFVAGDARAWDVAGDAPGIGWRIGWCPICCGRRFRQPQAAGWKGKPVRSASSGASPSRHCPAAVSG